ncbi:MAG: DUF2162 domain-containing protein [Desulfatiglans sp.]|jgi:predicted transporter|nr:DUF2162 domain-containing protein [Thermodesulfobacteriota bacterium]MEE4353017.1 DUF2162 domain-containing protein [Desulfatiglans sp.]
MLRQLWISGILTAFSLFAIKVGLGLGARTYSRAVSPAKKITLVLGTGLVYLVLFACLYLLVSHLNLLDYLDKLIDMLQYGMLLHFAVALGLFFWGARLLLQNPERQHGHSHMAVWLLILPCPVCVTVILLNLTLAYSIFSLSTPMVTLILFALFLSIVVLTLVLIFPFRHKTGTGNTFLGVTMVMAALYFLFTLIIAPMYPEIKAAFVMARSNTPANNIDLFNTFIFVIALFILGGVGFIRNFFFKGEST